MSQSLSISPKIEINSVKEVDKAACDFTAPYYLGI